MGQNKKKNTKYEILQFATKLFIERGYTSAYTTSIAYELGISPGNLTFHFPTKEHILAELIKELYMLPKKEERVAKGEHSLMIGYLLELVMIASVCQENLNIKELIVNAYTRPMSFGIIRENDTKRTVEVFGKYCPEWTETDYIQTENVVSGIEYAMFMTENTEKISFEQRVTSSLDAIMKVYEISEDIRKIVIAEIMAMDYYNMGKHVFEDFCNYVEEKM